MRFVENRAPRHGFGFVLFQHRFKRLAQSLQILLPLAVTQHISQHGGLPALRFAKIFRSAFDLFVRYRVERAPIHRFDIVERIIRRVQPAFFTEIRIRAAKPVLFRLDFNVSFAVFLLNFVLFSARKHVIARAVHLQAKRFADFYITIIVRQRTRF